jgi:hypothetical protein
MDENDLKELNNQETQIYYSILDQINEKKIPPTITITVAQFLMMSGALRVGIFPKDFPDYCQSMFKIYYEFFERNYKNFSS